jgi:DNA invertase Pin-like site-specific DNA recombinase
MFTIIGAMAELESSLISERVTTGMKAAEARGLHLGRSPVPTELSTTSEDIVRSVMQFTEEGALPPYGIEGRETQQGSQEECLL